MPTCRLCNQDKVLRFSHIVPEFLYANLYNEKGHMMGINGRGSKGWKPVQQGTREHLFCEACEQHFNECYEKPFRKQWIASNPLPPTWKIPEPLWIDVDYSSFKLFHLSVLFRAGVSSLPTFSEARLGPHEERLRRLLLAKDPGEAWQYPVFGLAIVHHETNAIVQLVGQVQQGRIGSSRSRCYAICYGGVQWWVVVASHPSGEFGDMSLQESGRIPIGSIPWNELSLIRIASRHLSRRTPKTI